MTQQESSKKAAISPHVIEWAMSSISKMKELAVPPLPEYYAVFFSYFSGTPVELRQDFEKVVQEKSHETPHLLASLKDIYDIHFGFRRRQEILEIAAQSIDNEFNNLLDIIDTATQTSASYTKALDHFTAELETLPSAGGPLRSAAENIRKETLYVLERNNGLQQQLDAALSQVQELRTSLDTVKLETLIDPLTGIGNRKAFATGLAALAQEAQQRGEPLTIIMADIDHFKTFNDTHGHRFGDQVLKLVARTLRDNVKGRDIVARYGGEEFVLLLPKTRLGDATTVAENMRRLVSSKRLVRRDSNTSLGSLTLSLGVTQFVPGEDEGSLVTRADQALYEAKNKGRNCVVTRNPPASYAIEQSGKPKPAVSDEVIEIGLPPA